MRRRGLPIYALFALVLSCSSAGDAPAPPPSDRVDSDFVFLEDAFAFANFGGTALGPQLTPSLVARMFGAENVCLSTELPCELNPVAAGWMESTNGTLSEGRSEGFAVASLLFHSGTLDPEEFGGETVADLRLFGNAKLQEELAYWAATQAVPSAVENDVRYQAKDVIPFLADALQPGSEKHYRLAIAQRTDTGFARGHAVTPIGYYKGQGDVYWLRIYDNNFPNRERVIEIDPVANTWRYEIPAIDDGEPIVYEGSSENKNELYFSAVEDRLGVLQAPFASDSTVRTISYSQISLVAKRGERETGIRDGQVLEADGDRVVPAFSKCPRCGADVPITNQTLIAQGIATNPIIEIQADGAVRTSQGTGEGASRRSTNIGKSPGDGDVDWLSATGPSFSTTVIPEGDVSNDSVRFEEDGSTSYTSTSGNGVYVTTSFDKGDGKFEGVSVRVEGSGDPDTHVTVSVKTGEDGETIVEVENLPEGKEVSVSVRRSSFDDPDSFHTETVTFTSNGDTATATVHAGDDKVAVKNANDVRGGDCDNGVLDEAYETDVDCGGQCNPCGDRKTCKVSADCVGGECVQEEGALVCHNLECLDGARNGEETDVDCGGDVCGRCVATENQATTPQCVAESDCDTGLCIEGRCRVKRPVIVVANRLPQEGVTLSYALDDTPGSFRLQSDTLAGPHQFVLGEAYKYEVNDLFGCSVDFGEFTTGLTSPEDNEPHGIIEVDCPEEGVLSILGELALRNGIAPIPADDPFTIELTTDGMTSMVTMSGGDQRTTIGTFSESWSARVIQDPSGMVENPTTPGEMGYYDCYALAWRNGSGAFRNLALGMMCEWTSTPPANCSDGITNQNESDVDCGGLCATRCELGNSCRSNTDCASPAICLNGACAMDGTCTDGQKNQGETDIDCGGGCNPCADDKACQDASDCSSNYCPMSVCRTPTCADGVKNQDETDVDCGGGICDGCQAMQTCVAAADCRSQICSTSGTCVMATCGDFIHNGDESDLDCGGSCSTKCANGDSCNTAADCSSQKCTNNLCAESCSDGIKNQDEFNVDCGGTNCAACPDGAACTLDSDCPTSDCECGASSGNCAGDTGSCGAAKIVVDLPTTDGVTTSGSFTVPASCPQVYVQAWGAAGGTGSSGGGGPGFGNPGGAGGYVSGTLSVSTGDVIDMWIGQGGDFGPTPSLGGTPGIGSKYGVDTRGGGGDGGLFTGGGAGGGGLTSVQITGSNSFAFLLPAGGGGGSFAPGGAVQLGAGGGAIDSNGEDAPVASTQAGGGAGEVGGSSVGSNGAGGAGTYGAYPSGFATADGIDGVPANTSAPDHSLCQGLSQGAVGAGTNEGTFDAGGDGCVILRCVAP